MQNNAKQQWASLLDPELQEEWLAWEATFTKEEYQEYQQDSEAFNDKIRQHLKDDPAGQEGLAIAKQCMDQINQHYGQKHGKIRTAFWKAYREGQIPESMVHKELVAWLVKAIDAYFAKRAKDVLSEIQNNLAVDPKSPQGQKLVQLWYDLVNEMWGGDEEMKAQVWDTVALEPMPEVRAWLKHAGARV